jgi:hypothetical protein
MKKLSCLKIVISLIAAVLVWVSSASAEPWKFGVISDTQWTKADDGRNPNSCAADIIKQVDRQFINTGVKLVIAVGDTVDAGSKINIDTRALYAQDLYNAGIGFYPLRGNHEAAEDPHYLLSGAEFLYAFPQIVDGTNNLTPSDIKTSIIPPLDLASNPTATSTGLPFTVGDNFSSPTAANTANNSISYSFDYNNARFILLDQFDAGGNYYNSTISAQQPWLDNRLSDTARPHHAFVFAHKNILGGSHKDNMFGGQANSSDPGDGFGVDISTLTVPGFAALVAKEQALDAFINSLADHGVRFCISGHDHNHYHSIVSAPLTPDKSIHQLIAQSDSSKFYTPGKPWSANDMPVAQDLYRVGYYIVTVDGPRVTVDYYASDAAYPNAFTNTPALHFIKRDSFSYSLNGREFLVGQGQPYTNIQDSFVGTNARILSGANGSTAADNTGRALVKAIETGWTLKPVAAPKTDQDAASNILSLWGMADMGKTETDVFTLSMNYDAEESRPEHLGQGLFGLATRDADGNWINAVDKNIGGTKKFVAGPWDPSYELGAYGIDPGTHTAWAVVNYNSTFAVARFSK